jgi:hypothetical protein
MILDALFQFFLQRQLKAPAQFRRCLSRKRDRCKVFHKIVSGRNARRHPPGHLMGLAGARARFHKQIPLQF